MTEHIQINRPFWPKGWGADSEQGGGGDDSERRHLSSEDVSEVAPKATEEVHLAQREAVAREWF